MAPMPGEGSVMTSFKDFTARRPLLLMGCGRMGSAMLAGWLEQGLAPDAVRIIDPAHEHVKVRFPSVPSANLCDGVQKLAADIEPAGVVLAVKPQMMDGALDSLKDRVAGAGLVISIAAGKSLSYFEGKLGADCPLVRAMPNTPAAIGRGITAAVANGAVTDQARGLAAALLSAVGAFAWVDDEALMDAVTAVSGSGPAYVFYLAECLAAAGTAAGLPADLARTLAVHTVSGAGALLDQSGEDPAILRENVTSPGGTTAAALEVLKRQDGLKQLMADAVGAAVRRGRELNG